jgi:hypothetical protein
VKAEWEPDELISAWTLAGSDWDLVANKTGGDPARVRGDAEVLRDRGPVPGLFPGGPARRGQPLPVSDRCSLSGLLFGEGTPLATREVFSADELAQLRGFPEPAQVELIRYFTLTPADEAFVRKFRGRENVLGVAVLHPLQVRPRAQARQPAP